MKPKGLSGMSLDLRSSSIKKPYGMFWDCSRTTEFIGRGFGHYLFYRDSYGNDEDSVCF